MKTDINKETKAAFFAQYVNQHVFFNQKLGYVHNLSAPNISLMDEEDFLMLKPLSEISDEDALESYRIFFRVKEANPAKPTSVWYKDLRSSAKHILDDAHLIDLLRSRGYAVPFRGLSVDRMREAGWIKLKTQDQ